MSRWHVFRWIVGATVPVFLLACGKGSNGPVDSGVISTKINGNDSDIEGTVIYKATNISTTSGNQWGEFIKQAKDECGGDPIGFEVTSLTVSNQSPFEDFVSAQLAIIFAQSTSSDIPHDPQATAGTTSNPTGTGPVELAQLATRDNLTALHSRLIGGDFEVVLRADTDQAGNNFDFDITVSIEARAHCD